MWTDSTPTELNRLFMQIDADSDGRVTWEELLTFLLQKNEAEGESEKNSFIYDLEQVAAPPNVAHSTGMTQLITMADKEKYLSIGRDATLKFWNFGTMQHARTVSLPEKSWVNAACYCASCSRLALATAHSKLLIFDTNTLRVQQGAASKGWRLPTVGTALCLVEWQELSVAWQSSLLLGDKEGTLFVYDWEKLLNNQLSPRLKIQLATSWIERISLSKEAGGLLSCSTDGTLQLHTLTVHGEFRLRNKVSSPTGKPIVCYAYSAPHASVATCGIERQIHWWSLSIAEPIVTMYGHAAAVVSLQMDDRNHQLISLDSESNVRVWDVRRFMTVQVIAPQENCPVSILLHDPLQQTLLLANTSVVSYPSSNAPVSSTAAGEKAERSGREAERRERSLLGAIASSTLALALSIDEASAVRSFHCADGELCFRFQLEETAGLGGMGQGGSNAGDNGVGLVAVSSGAALACSSGLNLEMAMVRASEPDSVAAWLVSPTGSGSGFRKALERARLLAPEPAVTSGCTHHSPRTRSSYT